MFKRNLIPVWIGIVVTTGLFLMGQEAWSPVTYNGVPKTGQVTSSYTGDDGELQFGVPWPNPRFSDNGDETVTDNFTGLVWTRDAQHISGLLNWYDCIDSCNNLEFAGFDDWRLPNALEILSLTDYENYDPALPNNHPFLNLPSPLSFWCSTTRTLTGDAYHVALKNGTINHFSKNDARYAWCVRGGTQ